MFDRSLSYPKMDSRHLRLLAGILLLAGVAAAAWWQSERDRAGRANGNSNAAPLSLSTPRIRPLVILDERGEAALPQLAAALNADDPHVRRDAILALSRIGEAARPYIPALQSALTDADPMVRGHAATALGRLDRESPKTAVALANLLADRHGNVRLASAAALFEMKSTAIAAVLPLLKNSDPEARLQAVQVLQNVRGYSTETTAALRRATNDSSPRVRESAIVALLLDQKADLTEVIRWIHDRSSIVSDTAVANLPRFGSAAAVAIPDLVSQLESPLPVHLSWLQFTLRSLNREAAPAIPPLLKLLDSPLEYDIGEILETLIEIGAEPAVMSPLLVRYLKDESPRMATRAGSLLSRLDPAEARAQALLLADELDSDSSETLTLALAGLRGLGVNAVDTVPRLIERLRDGNPGIHEQVAQVMARIGPPAAPAVPVIFDLLRDSPLMTRTTAALIEAAGAIGPAAAPVVPMLEELIGDNDLSKRTYYSGQTADRIRCAALVAAANIGAREPDYMEEVRAALSSGSMSMRIAALQAFSIVGEPARNFFPDILPTLHHGDPNVRLTAAQTVASTLGNKPEVVSALIGLLEDHDLEIRAAAAASLGRLGPAAIAAVPALNATRTVQDNYLPLSAARPQRNNRMTPAFLLENQVPFFSVAQAVEYALGKITPEKTAAAR